MPNIVIREQDLSDVATIDITENAVYVPGLSTKGDLNKPTRFTNIDDFKEEFGGPETLTNDADGVEDTSFKYAAELISAGVPVYFERVIDTSEQPLSYDEVNQTILTGLDTWLDKLTDKNAYNIKFITTGTYPVTINDTTFEKILNIAATRGDCIALVDVGKEKSLSQIQTDLKAIPDTDLESKYTITISGDKEDTKESTLKYGTIIAPWGTYSTKNYGEDIEFPGSFAYLTCLAKSTINYPNWYAVAGVNRGYINNLKQLKVAVTGSEADAVQTIKGISIVPITYINPYGYCIWGNRTLHKNDKDDLVASSFLNIRMLACDVKKTLYTAAKELMFETDSMQLWLDFKSKVTPLLDKMVSGNGLTDYSIKRVKSNMRATLKVVVTLYCVEAIENFDITLNITDSTVEVAE